MFDEMNTSPDEVRAHYKHYASRLAQQPEEVMTSRREEAEVIFRRVGITLAVYGAKDEDGAHSQRLGTFDFARHGFAHLEELSIAGGPAVAVLDSCQARVC